MTRYFSDSPIVSNRIALGVEYNGADYFGWQIQKKPAMPTVQEELEKALSIVANHAVLTVCAGRTDAGVHATNQCVHFETHSLRPEKAWVCGVNANLPDNIVVKWARGVPDEFHARFSATARTYRYVILNQPVRSATLFQKVTQLQGDFNINAMQSGADFLLGEHDFSAYRGASCQSNSPNRYVESIRITRHGNLIITEICANAFLLHMVRNIMGVLIEIGLGHQSPEWAKVVLESRDRKQAGKTVSPYGLYLVKAHYPESYLLPEMDLGPVFLGQ